ncbi:MAG: hypothetical protein VX938_06125 [Myxococcota bacterium]|nr:hypothetical protein [Myxococcota bacterium]MEE2780014.1 hypothetical protein [Myxococcota bacterium]
MTAALLALTFGVLAAGDFAIGPGHERLFSEVMPVRSGELPDGWVLRRLSVPQDRVEALYGPRDAPEPAGCDDAPVCVNLVHPTAAKEGEEVVGPYAISVHSTEADVAKLLQGLSLRLSAAKPRDPWKAVRVKLPPPPDDPPATTKKAPDGSPLSEDELAAQYRRLLSSDDELLGRLLRVELEPTRVAYVLRTDDGGETVVELRNRTPRQSHPDEVTRSFFVQGLGGVTNPPDLASRLHTAVGRADDGTLRLAPADVMATGERPPLHTGLIVATLLTFLGLLVVSGSLVRVIREELSGDRWVWGLLFVGSLLRLVLPGRLVEMGIGYQLTRLAGDLTLPRYGAGTTTLHHLVFQVFGVDHDVMIATHRVIGCLTLPLAVAAAVLVLRRWKVAPGPWFAPVWAAVLALTPALVRSDITESNLVPVLFGFWFALAGWLGLRGWRRVVATTAGLLLAGLSRPEMAVVAPAAWLVLCTPWRELRPAAWVAGSLGLVLPWQLFFVRRVVDWEIGEKSLHLDKGMSPDRLADVIQNNALFDWRIFPFAVLALGLWALWRLKDQRPLVIALLLSGLLWLYVYAVDLSQASQPRLHIVGLLAWSLVGCVLLAELYETRRALAWGAAGLWILSAAVTIPALWAPTNEDTRDELFDELRSSIPEGGPYTLALLSPVDAPDEPGHYTHRHPPGYGFRDGQIIPLGGLERALSAMESDGTPLYYFQGVACYARILRARQGGKGLLPACAAVHQHFKLEPVWEHDVPNYGNPVHQELGYYSYRGPYEERSDFLQRDVGMMIYSPDEPTFRVGLWRVRDKVEPRGNR